MKTFKLFTLLAISATFFVGCNNDDDNTPDPVNEEEVITSMTVTLMPEGGGISVILETRDLDGDGPNPPEVSVSGPLSVGTTYMGSIAVVNETKKSSIKKRLFNE